MKKKLTISLNFIPMNLNKYINCERKNKYYANSIKQKEKILIKDSVKDIYNGNYPVCITFKPHFSHKRSDLDNFRMKGILDGLVNAGVIKNDNLNCIQRIIIEPIFDEENKVEIEIEEI